MESLDTWQEKCAYHLLLSKLKQNKTKQWPIKRRIQKESFIHCCYRAELTITYCAATKDSNDDEDEPLELSLDVFVSIITCMAGRCRLISILWHRNHPVIRAPY